MKSNAWLVYTALVVVTWGVWGAFSAWPTTTYGYPDQWTYIIWSLTMIIPCYFSLRGKKIDFSGKAVFYGCLIGFTGAGGQLLLFKTLATGAPAYIVFPIISISPAITVLMSLAILKERVSPLGAFGVVIALLSVVFFSVSDSSGQSTGGYLWLIYAILICVAWGVQAFFMKRASNGGVEDSSIFFYMTLTGILLAPVAWLMIADHSASYPLMAPVTTAAIQILNAVGALFLVMALSRGKATIVAPCTNALAPVLTSVLSLILYQSVPGGWALAGIIFAIGGSTFMVYSEERTQANKFKATQMAKDI